MPDQPPARATLLQSTGVALARMIAAVTFAVLVIIPDREIAAKLFKVGLILDNVQHRGLGGS